LIFFVFRFDLSFIGLDNNRELKSEIFITYLEGDEIFYRQKGKNKKNLSYGDEIKKNVSIETGNDSYASIFIKGQGFYYLYPNTSLYFEELENFLLKKYEKKSQIILERGVIFININLFSKNSKVTLKTDDAYFDISKSKSIIDKNNDFQTKFFGFEGEVLFSPYSSKFELYESKKNYDISGSVERLLNSNNILKDNQYVVIDMEDRKKLEGILKKIYESKNTKLINKKYVENSLSIEKFPIENIDFNIPNLDIADFEFNRSIIELTAPPNGENYLENVRLENSKRYLNSFNKRSLVFVNDLGFTKNIYNISINEMEYKHIKIKEFKGIKNISVNDKFIDFSIQSKDIDIDAPNYLLCSPNQKFDYVKNINIKSDVKIKKIIILIEKERDINNFFKIGEIKINEEKYFMYDYGFDDYKNIYVRLNKDFENEEIKILCFFEETNQFYM